MTQPEIPGLGTPGGSQRDLTLRLTECDRASSGLFATVEGSGHGTGHAALGLQGPASSVRLNGNQLRGTATTQGASGEVSGPIVFVSNGQADVSCATARWSMGRFSQ